MTVKTDKPARSAASRAKTPKKTAETAAVEKKKYADGDLIPCVSYFAGELTLIGRKTGNHYVWLELGDVREVEYQDLMAEIINRHSVYIYAPMILIDDEELIADRDEIKEIYGKICSPDKIRTYIQGGKTKMLRSLLAHAPESVKAMTRTMTADMISSHELDRMSVIKELDAILGTKLVKSLE